MVAAVTLFLPIAAGCGQGFVTGSQSDAATLVLVADDLGALQLEACVAKGKRSDCVRYPNPHECTSMRVVVGLGGETDATCYQERAGESAQSRITDAIPFVCNAASSDGCLRCLDLYGSQVLSRCEDDPGSGSDTPGSAGDDQQGVAGDQSSPVLAFLGPGHEPETVADLANTIELVLSEYATTLNEIFADEGLDIDYEPDLDGVDDLASDPILDWLVSSFDFMEGICQFAGDLGLLEEGFDSSFCWTNMAGNPICRCAAMVATAARMTCELVETLGEVDPRVYGALWLEMGNVINWLLSMNPIDIVTLVDGAMGCSGSPLVLDLAGDGFALTSVEEGPLFDLYGRGAVRTAWVQGDDALLALDRNGNGTVDDASELFGEGIDLDGVPSANGFRALSLLDGARHGGNENGRVDSGDALFAELLLWNDSNGDGRSQSDELRKLGQAGISSLNLSSSYSAGERDAHGNDLGLRGSFARDHGETGAMVDAYFRFALPE